MTKAVILGGTKGLGLELARVAAENGCPSNIYGRSLENDQINGSSFYHLDLCDEESIKQLEFNNSPAKYLFWIAGAFLKNKLVDTSLGRPKALESGSKVFPENEPPVSSTLSSPLVLFSNDSAGSNPGELKEQLSNAFGRPNTSPEVIDNMIRLHYSSAIKFIIKFIKNQKNTPFHLLTIASCSSWRLREDETIYCSLKAAQATFTRNLAVELARDLPGSKVTLINPGGLQTQNFWKDIEQDTSEFLDPYKVANIIWNLIQNQKIAFQEVQILRRKPIIAGAEPIIEFGPKIPEVMS